MGFSATLQFRTTLDQAGRIAGLAGELDIHESEVLRLLLDRALEGPAPKLLASLRAELKERARENDEAVDRAEREGLLS